MVPRPPFERHHSPEFWLTRNPVVAERLWYDARYTQEHGPDAPHVNAFLSLGPTLMEEAVRRYGQHEDWFTVLKDLAAQQRARPRRSR